jgi:hypothetical protein
MPGVGGRACACPGVFRACSGAGVAAPGVGVPGLSSPASLSPALLLPTPAALPLYIEIHSRLATGLPARTRTRCFTHPHLTILTSPLTSPHILPPHHHRRHHTHTPPHTPTHSCLRCVSNPPGIPSAPLLPTHLTQPLSTPSSILIRTLLLLLQPAY